MPSTRGMFGSSRDGSGATPAFARGRGGPPGDAPTCGGAARAMSIRPARSSDLKVDRRLTDYYVYRLTESRAGERRIRESATLFHPPPRIVGVSGSLGTPSRTTSLVRSILARFEAHAETSLLELAVEAPALFATLPTGPRGGRAAAVIEAVETADLLVVGSPVYRASYTGALKHLFDLVDRRALEGTPVLLCATGGTPLHGLMPDHQLRPLFGFFNAITIPTAVYALDGDFDGHALHSIAVSERIDRAAAEARLQLRLVMAQRSGTVIPLAANG